MWSCMNSSSGGSGSCGTPSPANCDVGRLLFDWDIGLMFVVRGALLLSWLVPVYWSARWYACQLPAAWVVVATGDGAAGLDVTVTTAVSGLDGFICLSVDLGVKFRWLVVLSAAM